MKFSKEMRILRRLGRCKFRSIKMMLFKREIKLLEKRVREI